MKYSLFIGRFQPLHEGHIALFEAARKQDKKILVALRDTPVDEKNPYTVEERMFMFKNQYPIAKVIAIPDIEEICYGRDVGYGITEIRLDEQTENISATQIREDMKKNDTHKTIRIA